MRPLLLSAALFAMVCHAEPPGVSHIFPAGGQRGTTVTARIGGFYFHGHAGFMIHGVEAANVVKEVETFWIEGPMITKPASQKGEDYPKDHAITLKIANDATTGVHHWHCHTSQGSTPTMKFVVGDLPEVIEQEINGAPIPEQVKLPVTINGRIFPREDMDLWRFHAEKGQVINCTLTSRALGYPLDGLMEISGPDGRVLREAARGSDVTGDPTLVFTARESGHHTLKLHDAGFDGGPHFVYRLTLQMNPHDEAKNTAHLDDLPEFAEQPMRFTLPAAFVGCIAKPNEGDVWSVELKKDQTLDLDLVAARIGSKLDSVIVLSDAAGHELTRNDDASEASPDSRVRFTAKNDGEHRITITDRFATRGGTNFSYRVRATLGEKDDFDLTLASDVVNITRQTEAGDADFKKKPAPKGSTLRVNLAPLGNFAQEVQLTVAGLPAGVTLDKDKLGAKQKFIDLRFIAPPRTPVQIANITIRGTAEVDGRTLTHEAIFPTAIGEPAITQARLGIAPPAPFRHVGEYWVTNDQPAGTTMSKHFQLQRDHFDAPITVSFADRQGRCLQAASAKPMLIPAGATDFTYTVLFPPDLELGRTNRQQLMLVAEITDFDGSRHTVSHTSFEQNEQMISVVSEGMLRLTTANTSYPATASSSVSVPFTLRRDPLVAQRPMRITLQLPPHIKDITADPATLAGGATNGTLTLHFGSQPGPFNLPVTLLAQTADDLDPPHAAAAKIELVPSK